MEDFSKFGQTQWGMYTTCMYLLPDLKLLPASLHTCLSVCLLSVCLSVCLCTSVYFSYWHLQITETINITHIVGLSLN